MCGNEPLTLEKEVNYKACDVEANNVQKCSLENPFISTPCLFQPPEFQAPKMTVFCGMKNFSKSQNKRSFKAQG